jgi:5'(3')-deoxyribonucleotidase
MKKKNKSNDVGVVVESVSKWEMFVRACAAHVDPVLASMLYATEFVQFDQPQKIVRVATLKKFVLFQDLFIEQKKIYQEYLDRIFGFQTVLVVEFINVAEPKKVVSAVQNTKNFEQPVMRKNEAIKSVNVEKQRSLDVSDQQKWKVTHALLEHFGGTVKEIIKDTHEFDA